MWEAVTWVTATTAAQSVWVVVFCFFFLVVFLSVVCLLAFANPRFSLFVCFVRPLLA